MGGGKFTGKSCTPQAESARPEAEQGSIFQKTGEIWAVGEVIQAVLACVLRATSKKVVNFWGEEKCTHADKILSTSVCAWTAGPNLFFSAHAEHHTSLTRSFYTSYITVLCIQAQPGFCLRGCTFLPKKLTTFFQSSPSKYTSKSISHPAKTHKN